MFQNICWDIGFICNTIILKIYIVFFKLFYVMSAEKQYIFVETDVTLTINDPNIIGKNDTIANQ